MCCARRGLAGQCCPYQLLDLPRGHVRLWIWLPHLAAAVNNKWNIYLCISVCLFLLMRLNSDFVSDSIRTGLKIRFCVCIQDRPCSKQCHRNCLSSWFLSASSNEFHDVILSASFVLSCICSKSSALLMLFYLCLIKGFVAAAFHGSVQNHLENIHPLKVIFLRVPCRLRFAGCWMLLNWKRPYLKGNGCRQSFKNIKSYSTNSSQNVMGV